MPGTLTTQVIAICDDALGRMSPGPGRTAIEQVRSKLRSPLRIAIAGSVSSGKSTLVNALLGQKVAAVDAGECTRVVTWFCYDHHERAEIHLRSGVTRTLNLTQGRGLPDDLGAPFEDIDRVMVWLSNEQLREVSIIDTPGLNTVTESNQSAAADLLGLGDSSKEATDSRVAISEADALIFLMPHVRESDLEILTQFRSLFRGTGLTAINAVGVLSKIDKLDANDPWGVARRITDRVRGELRGVVSDIIPVIGLLAETANTDQFNEGDANVLRAFTNLDEIDREDLLLTPEDFVGFDAGSGQLQRRRLLSMLDLYGVGLAIDALADEGTGATAVLARLDEASGFAPLRAVVRDVFARRADLLKAHAGICDLQRISYSRDDPDNGRHLRGLRAPLERIELDAAMHDLKLIEVLHQAYSGDFPLPEDLYADLERIALGQSAAVREGLAATASPSEIAAAAATHASRWGEYAHDPRRSPDERRMARDVKEGHELLWDATSGQTPSPESGPTAPLGQSF